MFGSGFNGDVNKIKILDVLNDGELHEFRIIKVCDHTENQRKAFKFHYDPEFNFYYRLSYVDKDNIKWFTETTFNQAITKAIFKEIEYYNKSIIEKHKADSINIDGFEYYNKNINKNEKAKYISIQLVKSGKYNKYFVQVLERENYNEPFIKSKSDIEKLFNKFKKSLELVKYANMNKRQTERFNYKFGSSSIADYEIMTDDIIKCINLINDNKHEELLDVNIDMLTNHTGNTISKQIKEIKKLKATEKYFDINKYVKQYTHERFRMAMCINDDEYLNGVMREIEDAFNKYIEEVDKCKETVIKYCYSRI